MRRLLGDRRRLVATLILGILIAMPAAALAQSEDGPVVDVVEIAGIIDRPIERYLLERIDDAEARKVELLVFQIDSLGSMKATGDPVSEVVTRILQAEVPVAVHVGPRRARGAGMVLAMGRAADIFSVGPSALLGPAHPLDHGDARRTVPAPTTDGWLAAVDAAAGRDPLADRLLSGTMRASASLESRTVDVVAASVADLLVKSDTKQVRVGKAQHAKVLALPKDGVTVRFEQPGPIRRLLHTFANPTLAYLMLISAALLLVFELFQPGFGVAGVTGALLLAATVYGFTVLPVRAWPLTALIAGLVLLTLDVARDAIGPPTLVGAAGLLAGSIWLYPGGSDAARLSPWLIGFAMAGALIVFVPVMTVVRRARHPMATEAKRALVGEVGEVRSMLNPEGFALVDGEIWRARSADGTRVRVGEQVVVASVDGTVLIVKTSV